MVGLTVEMKLGFQTLLAFSGRCVRKSYKLYITLIKNSVTFSSYSFSLSKKRIVHVLQLVKIIFLY